MDFPEPGFIRVEINMLIKEEEYRAMIDRYVINYLKASYPESISLSALKAWNVVNWPPLLLYADFTFDMYWKPLVFAL